MVFAQKLTDFYRIPVQLVLFVEDFHILLEKPMIFR